MKEGERYQLKRGVVQMEIVSNLCASKEATEKEHARKVPSFFFGILFMFQCFQRRSSIYVSTYGF